MQKIKLFSQYNLDALFLKTQKEIDDQISQWPDHYFYSGQIQLHVETLRTSLRVDLPEIDFKNGRQVMLERILPASVFQPGLRNNANVRVDVLIFEYQAIGHIYLLGCCPPLTVPEPPGDWYADPVHQQIIIEYAEYEKHPRKTLIAHQYYTASLQLCYESLKDEFAVFYKKLNDAIDAAITERKSEIDDMKRMLDFLK
ncbi:hypothetical protein MUK70_10180 [Dyadobacter chenwenxiniae]|uniref:Uncharacterized protein n=1 Tax=Dyadobacter chenwenxiniae TaxID=2906456 RepID=A0A9X1TFR9_9BACT|nr:hypothetical protein [Dyadobacter chenwenxiniae]MCF0063267.1 hypothetical protein [Dyadobacter chenwenxiniae]UON85353.1 hypothetical protein MUK70_10180 [Dyadobacter chenwenxiniae]